MSYIRAPYHAGSWYTDNGIDLRATIISGLNKAKREQSTYPFDNSSTSSSSFLSAYPPPLSPNQLLESSGVDKKGVATLLRNQREAQKQQQFATSSPPTAPPPRIAALYGPHSGLTYSAASNSHAYRLLEEDLATSPLAEKNNTTKSDINKGDSSTAVPNNKTSSSNGNGISINNGGTPSSSSSNGNSQQPVTIFLLGPNHRKRGLIMEVSGAKAYSMPWALPASAQSSDGTSGGLVDVDIHLPCDTALLNSIREACCTREVNIPRCIKTDAITDEEEHGLEMHLPFVLHLLEKAGLLPSSVPASSAASAAASAPPPAVTATNVRLVPIIFGSSLSEQQLKNLAEKVLAPHFAAPRTLFVISTDFCHWGSRFGYTYRYNPEQFPVIGDDIKAMDLEAVSLISKKSRGGFLDYLDNTENTICGRHPVTVLLSMLEKHDEAQKAKTQSKGGAPITTTTTTSTSNNNSSSCSNASSNVVAAHYSQSERIASTRGGSSVSYASGVVVV